MDMLLLAQTAAPGGLGPLFTTDNAIALLTLTALEIVLGIDNIVFIAILTGKLPKEQSTKARNIGLLLAMGMRILLLLTLSWVMSLKAALFTLGDIGFSGDLASFGLSGKDLILIAGGTFLIAKATTEIHGKIEGGHDHHAKGPRAATFASVIAQILVIDLVFSLDSVITAVGMAQDIRVMVAAVVIAVLVMLVAAGPVSRFVERHPTVKMLALSFLLLIGVLLVADGFHQHIPKGYIYFAMAFSLLVEFLNLAARSKAEKRKAPAPHA